MSAEGTKALGAKLSGPGRALDSLPAALGLFALSVLAGLLTVARIAAEGMGASSVAPLLITLIAGTSALVRLAARDGWPGRIATPLLFGLLLLWAWEVVVTAFQVPRVLLPAPSAIADALGRSWPTLAADFRQTFVRSVIPGYAMGCGAGFLVAIAIDRSPFLQRGLLPLGSLVSAMPIVGIAPIMVMWFGFDWQSKAAVVVVMTFFPMLVNTLAGLAAAGSMERDLMRSYAAGYLQTLARLRLPNALPFIFNALKLNSTLALIGAIVAEFFGTPIVGMGFRISTEVARMNVDVVWATIAVAALAGSASYGLIALVERGTTFWHPSFRK
ncbi:ABC transporter permease [Arenibaculum pallidiluteum]|uniref:ABC transporter permease n=1 Tax=Arenibaculum pallidiluteum TaxID=2812559 RepID=UPI002E2BDB6A|nr:ABC transporter permease [Arenibaculum pallidiluteum]